MKPVYYFVLSLIVLSFPISVLAASASTSSSSSSNGISVETSAAASVEQPTNPPESTSSYRLEKPRVKSVMQSTPVPKETLSKADSQQTLPLNDEAKTKIDKIQTNENDITAKISEIEKRQIKTLKLYLANLIAIFLVVVLQIIIIIRDARPPKEEIITRL